MAPEKLEKAELQNPDNGGEKTSNVVETVEMSRDEYTLATLGYRQVFVRSFGLFEDVGHDFNLQLMARCATKDVTQWAATFTTMNFVSGMPVLFGFAMYVCPAKLNGRTLKSCGLLTAFEGSRVGLKLYVDRAHSSSMVYPRVVYTDCLTGFLELDNGGRPQSDSFLLHGRDRGCTPDHWRNISMELQVGW
jgi:hypothetical protein